MNKADVSSVSVLSQTTPEISKLIARLNQLQKEEFYGRIEVSFKKGVPEMVFINKQEKLRES